MRKGIPHPTASDTPSVDVSTRRRGRSQASRLLRSPGRGPQRFQGADNDDATVADFRNLLHYSSAGICLLSFATPVACDTNEWSFTDALYAASSKCLQTNASFARSRSTKSPEELLGQDLNTLFPETLGYREMFQTWHNHHLSREGFECRVTDPTGKFKHLQVACYGQITGKVLERVWIVTRESTKKLQPNRTSTTSEQHLTNLLNQPGVMFMRAYPDGAVSFFTEEARKALGIDPHATHTVDTILGPRCHPSDRPHLESLIYHRHSRALTPARATVRLINEHRGLRTYSLYQLPSCVGDVVNFYDIIAVEPPIVVAKPAPFLASGFAHDANNHLLIASANVEAAERLLGESHPALTPLKAALSAITQTSEIYSQARRLEYGITPHVADIDLAQEFQEIIAQCAPLLSDKITLSTPLSCGEIFVRVDPTHLRQILTNLILNAREALQEHGAITLSATRKGKDPAQRCPIHGHEIVCVSVSDNGPGIDLPILETIFTPFFSTKSSSTPRGLGLAMVKTLVERNNGEVSATSAHGIGTTFTLCLPAASSAGRVDESSAPLSAAPSRPLTLLVADDEADVRDIFQGALTARGHRPTVCESGLELVKALKAKRTHFDAIIVDDGMPGSSSGELIRTIRETHPQMPIVVVSGDPMAIHRIAVEGLRTSFLAKPFTFERLYSHVETAAGPNISQAPTVTLRRRAKVPNE